MQIIEKTYELNGSLTKRSRTERIFLHHAAATNCTVEDIDRWHKNNGWTCIGYHFFINKKGEIYRGRPENTIGAHASNNNSDSLGICFEGNFEAEEMTTEQIEAGKELVSYLKEKYSISKVLGHRDVNNTSCPGRNFRFEEIANGKKEENKEEFEMAKTYKNGSTIENVYADTALKNKIGSLNKWEQCECLGIVNGKYIVKYKVDGTNNYKVGFVKYNGGIQ